MRIAIVLALLGVLVAPSAMMLGSAQEQISVEIAEGADDVENERFYVPARITIPVGSTVSWTNLDDAPHTVTSGTPTCPGLCWGLDFASGIMRLDDVYSFTFNETGVYNYLCSLHPWMKGTVTVLGEGQEPPVEITVRTELQTYNVGDEVLVEGSVSSVMEGAVLIVEILNPNGEVVVSEEVPVSEDGNFTYMSELSGPQMIAGSYTVRVNYADTSVESVFDVEGTVETGSADVRVIAKQIRDLVLVRVTNADDSGASVYGITLDTSSEVIEAFRGPRTWNDESVTASEATTSAGSEPLAPGDKTYFKLKVSGDDFTVHWMAFDSSKKVLDEGDFTPIRR